MSPKTGNEKPRQPRGDHLQTKTNAARQYKKTMPNFPPPESPKSHDNPEESIENKAQPQPEIDTKFPKHGFQIARKRHLKKATPTPWRASFFEACLRVAFFKLIHCLSYCSKLQIESLSLQTEPGKPRQPRGEHLQTKSHATR